MPRAISSRAHQSTDDLTIPSMTGYPGSKGSMGVLHTLIRQMPPHRVYIEPFAGRAAIWRNKVLANCSILIDADAKVCHHLRSYIAGRSDCALAEKTPRMFHEAFNAQLGPYAQVEIVHGDALDLLPPLPPVKASDTLVFLDPPYLGSTRTKKVLYDFDLTTPQAHKAILGMIRQLGCLVMICGYPSELYNKTLKRWRRVDYPAMTRGGPRIECCWCNFNEPAILHDARYAGANFRERDQIKRRALSFAGKFSRMDPRVRQAVAAAMVRVDRAAVEAAILQPLADPLTKTSEGGPRPRRKG